MKIIHKDLKHGNVKIKVDSAQDLWYLSSIIEENDVLAGMTERKIKLGGADEKAKVSKRIVFLKITAEKIEYTEDSSSLRVSGPIIEAPEDIPKGDYHTFSLEDGTIIEIQKESWSTYLVKKLEEASRNEIINILVVAFDREEALFVLLKSQGYDVLLDMKGDVAKKGLEEKKGNFYQEIYKQIKDYDSKYLFTNIVVASPAFWKEYLLKEIDDEKIRKKMTLATCSSIDGSTINEILKRPELKSVLEKDKSSKEEQIMEELLAALRKDNAAYGTAEVSSKIESGNISALLVSENLIRKLRSEKKSADVEGMMESAEALNADIKIISTHDAAKKLDGIGGIAAMLRWKENYS